MSNIQKRISPQVVIFKKKSINLHRGLQIYTSNREQIIQIPSAAPSFMGIWAIQSPLKRHCYTCMSFKTYWSRLIYTKLSSHRSFVINMYVVTMAWRCISPWSFHRSPQRRRETNIFRYISRFPRILSKNNQKEKRRKPRLNTRDHWESESRNRILSAAVLHVKPSRHNSNLYGSQENHHKVEI